MGEIGILLGAFVGTSDGLKLGIKVVGAAVLR